MWCGGESMEPTLLRGDVVWVGTWGTYIAEVGDVVVLQPERMETVFVKRVAGLEGALVVDGESWDVPEGRVFVLGDNRGDSLDSRHAVRMGGTGIVPGERIVGEVGAVLFSFGKSVVWWKPWTWLRWDRWMVEIE